MEAEKFYHIYNRTNNKELLFKDEENYRYFLSLFQKYICPIAQVHAYCLIQNHFHFVLQIKSEEELIEFFKDKIERLKIKKDVQSDLQGFQNLGGEMSKKLISQQFSNLFNAYSKEINKRYKRNGSLFSQNFKRKEISSNKYLTQVIVYVHLNPESHRIVGDFKEYAHSSYHSILSSKETLISKDDVIDLFDDEANFIAVHNHRALDEKAISGIVDIDE